MLSPVVAQTENFARLFFHEIETMAEAATWIPASEAFSRTIERHATHPYALHISAKPARHIAFTRISERIRKAEFEHIERRKTGAWRSAPVFFRVRPENRALVPAMPREIIGGAGAAERVAPDLALLHRAFAHEREADAAAATLSPPALRALFERACVAFEWQQPTWPERLSAVLRRLVQSVTGWLLKGRHKASSAA